MPRPLLRLRLPAAPPRADVPVEPTHLGPAVDQRVAEARRALRTDAGPDYRLVAENFDFAHYLLQGPPLIERHRIDLVQHFLRDGVELDRSPDVNFSMSRYLERHPERAHGPGRSPYAAWLRTGRDAGEIADPAPGVEKAAPALGMTPHQLADTLGELRTDLRERFLHGRLGEVFAKAAEIEPLIGSVAGRVLRPTIPPLLSEEAVDQVAAIRAAQEAAGHRRARLVLPAAPAAVGRRPPDGGGTSRVR
ncbi:hypothetical protein [Nocardioides sp. TF02-7]|uniref:hypothetical protein n=1 Tax=Nocardioides sp. TF02-7 TaxID=2917724 RepID=UPI001F0562B6|nr:hypothetical protein [Nocardioides sp. TF02-7]UMG93046.1 hypothetical protein MF408_01495 [Nocardioides sp. TF02-7]